jgi:hypothetical protein
MRPRTLRSPTRSVGASSIGALNDALMSIWLSLTCGNRWRNLPASHCGLVGVVACANASAGNPKPSTAADDARRKSRRSMLPSHDDWRAASRPAILGQPVVA